MNRSPNRTAPRAAAAAAATTTAEVAISASATAPSPTACSLCRIDPERMAADLQPLVDKAVAAIAAAVPTPDAVLGSFISIAALIRSVSFHEGRLLEEAMIAIGEQNPDLVVLGNGVRLPVTPAALEAVAHNRTGALTGLCFDADARTRASYTPDLVTVNRRHRSALVIDVKRSLASYLDTHRLAELRTRMLAASLILPDWLYKERKRIAVDSVGIAIVDGSGGTSDHASGLWSLAEIDALLEVEGAARAMARMREGFAARVQALIRDEVVRQAAPWCTAVTPDASRSDAGDRGGGNHFRSSAMAGGDVPGTVPIARTIRFGFARPHLHA